MKILKLAAIFLVLVGGIFLALNWNNIFPDDKKKGDNWSSEDKVDITQKCNEIRTDWAKQTGWNADLYKNERDDIDQSKAMGLFSREGFNTVNNALRESATNKTRDGYMAALKAQPFNEKDLKAQMAGITTLKEKEKMGEDTRIQNIEKINQLYNNVKGFVGSRHTISPYFDNDKTDWKSFSSLQNGILGTAKKYRENPLFIDNMKHIPGFVDGLDENYLKSVTEPQRKDFYNRLSEQIIAYFRTQEPTDDKQRLLTQIYKNFSYQESDYGLDSLANFKVRYGQ